MELDAREQRGMEIAATFKLARRNGAWIVPSQTGKGKYTVYVGAHASDTCCTCPDHEQRACKCKHIYAVEYAMRRENNGDGTETVHEQLTFTKTVKRPTYRQDWPAYNEAQTNEKRLFQELLHDLCSDLQDPPQERGRPRLPLRDAVFAVTFKIYSTFSGRRFISDLCDAHGKGYIGRVPHFNSIFNYLENPSMTPLLQSLIVRSSLPLRAVESDFAVDSTGFTTSRFRRWYDHKYGHRQEQDWVKAHIMCGVKTNVVTAVEIHDRNANDSPLLRPMLATTAQNFTVREVSADKGYSGVENHTAIAALGADPFIMFKFGTTAAVGGAFEKMFHFFSLKRDEFMQHYHKRSNVESTVSMIKAKFRDHVRSKTDVAMKNEVLCKVLCHNIACVIGALYELGIQPAFGLEQ